MTVKPDKDSFKPSRRSIVQGSAAFIVALAYDQSALAQTAGAAPPPPAAAPAATPPSLIDPTKLDSWLALDKKGRVTVYFGKIDVGQGTDSAIGQMVAEELDVPFEWVDVEMSNMSKTVNQGDISGSTGVSNAGLALRNAAAEARRVLLMNAADHFKTDIDKLSVADGVITVTANPKQKITYAQLLGGKSFNADIDWNKQIGNTLSLTAKAPLKTPDQFKIIGKAYPRYDIPGKVFANKDYVQDIKVKGMVHGRAIRPPYAGATIVSVDESSLAGIAGAQVVRKSDFIGVVANTEWGAIQAQQKLKVQWSPAKDVFPDQANLYDYIRQAPSNKNQNEVNVGNIDSGFQGAAKVVQAEYEWPFQSHASMGGGCGVADVHADHMECWTGSPKPHFSVQGVATILNLPQEKVLVHSLPAPGSYGRNDDGDALMDAVVMSQVIGKPVRVQYMRFEGTQWDPKAPPSVHTVKAALDAQGNMVAIDYHAKGFSRLEFAQHEGNPGDTLAGQLTGFKPATPPIFGVPNDGYVVANKRYGWDTIAPLLPSNSPLRTTHMRDPLGPQLTFASESFIDECAFAAGADPVEYRIRHLDKTKNARDIGVIKAAAEKAGWKTGPHGTRRGQNGDVMTGQGVAYAQRSAGFAAAVADVEVNPQTGKVWVKRVVLAHDVGLVINPFMIKNVIEGCVIQGISRSTIEEVNFNRQNVTSVDWATYPVIEIGDVPETIDVVLVENKKDKSSGAGETAIRMVGPAIANAVFEATGVRVRRAPMTPAHVRAGMAALKTDDQKA